MFVLTLEMLLSVFELLMDPSFQLSSDGIPPFNYP